MALEAGQMIAHYRVAEKIGEGGMGEVYRAEDTRLNRDVALKVLPEAFAADNERMTRFAREAQVLASLNHPNVGSIYGLEQAGNTHCLVLELVGGKTLDERIKQGPLPLEDALAVAYQIAEGLEAAHEGGIIHRDLKPANIKVTDDGTVKILDFGLAKAIIGDTGSPETSMSPTLTTPATHQGVILGTAAYMSPEQAKGLTADRRADIWAFGVVLHEMLSGRRLFSTNNVSETLAAVLMKEPDMDDLPASTPAAVGRLIKRCLQKEPRNRLQAIGEARILIDEYRANPEDASHAQPAAPVPARTGNTQLPWLLTGISAVALMAALWLLWPAAGPGVTDTEQVMRLEVGLTDEKELRSETGMPIAFSADGRIIAYCANDGITTQLYVRRMEQSSSTLLAGTEGAHAQFFSPDGRWIGFFAGQKLKKVSVTGGAPLTLTDTATDRGGTWSAEGNIVFARDISSGLSLIPASGGPPQTLTELSEGERSHRWPFFMPDGKHVLFLAQDEGSAYDDGTIEAVNIETGKRVILHEGGTFPRYLPTGHLIYGRGGTLFATRMDASLMEVTGAPTPLLDDVYMKTASNSGDGTVFYSFSDNGTLAYISGSHDEQNYALMWVDRDGQESPLIEEKRPYYSPRLSPDERYLALNINTGNGSDIWVQDLERDVLTRLTFSSQQGTLPVWDPDGRNIFFDAIHDATKGIYRVPSDGSGQMELVWADDRSHNPVSFSPEGHLAVHASSPSTSWDLEVLQFEEGKAVKMEPFLQSPGIDIFPMFSPDGKWIAYSSNESGVFEIYIRPYPGPGGKWQVSTNGGENQTWTSDGRELIYRKNRQWFSVSIDAQEDTLRIGRPRVILEADYANLDVFPAFEFTDDGSRMIVLKGDDVASGGQTNKFHLILNWFQEVNQLSPEVN